MFNSMLEFLQIQAVFFCVSKHWNSFIMQTLDNINTVVFGLVDCTSIPTGMGTLLNKSVFVNIGVKIRILGLLV